MASEILNLDAHTIYVGDDDPTNTLLLRIKSTKLPELEEVTKEHLGGGAMAQLVIGMRAFKMSPFTFKLEGYNPEIDRRFMPITPRRIKYTVRGNITNLRTHAETELKIIIEGRMTKMTKSELERDKSVESDYEINEIVWLEEFHGGVEKKFFDYWAGPAGLRIEGQPVAPTLARNLGVA